MIDNHSSMRQKTFQQHTLLIYSSFLYTQAIAVLMLFEKFLRI